MGADGDAEKLNQGPRSGWEDLLSPCEVTPRKSSPLEMPYQPPQPEPASLARCGNVVHCVIPEV